MNFTQLKFEAHRGVPNGRHALEFFPNGYGVSVVTGTEHEEFNTFHTDVDHPYEIAVLKGTAEHWIIDYDIYLTDDVINYQTIDDVSHVLNQVAELTGD